MYFYILIKLNYKLIHLYIHIYKCKSILEVTLLVSVRLHFLNLYLRPMIPLRSIFICHCLFKINLMYIHPDFTYLRELSSEN